MKMQIPDLLHLEETDPVSDISGLSGFSEDPKVGRSSFSGIRPRSVNQKSFNFAFGGKY